MKRFLSIFMFLFVLALPGVVKAQPDQLPEPLYSEKFDSSTGIWTPLGATAKVSVEHEPENRRGQGALRFDYQIAPGQDDVLLCPFAPYSLATLQSISFWIKADHTTSMAFGLQEQNGGRFLAAFSVVENQWQHVELSPGDFVLQDGKDDPKDGNGTLDLNRIEAAALLDFDQIIAPLSADPGDPLGKLLGVQLGLRTLFLDDITFSSNPGSAIKDDKNLLDDFKSPQASWLQVGNVALKTVVPEPPKNSPSVLQADYTQSPNRIAAFSRLLWAGALRGKTSLSFRIVSRQKATLIVQLEEKGGGKYNTILELPASLAPDAVPELKTLVFADFKPSDDSRDDDDRLDLDQVKQLLFIDASGLLGGGAGQNTLQLSQLRVK